MSHGSLAEPARVYASNSRTRLCVGIFAGRDKSKFEQMGQSQLGTEYVTLRLESLLTRAVDIQYEIPCDSRCLIRSAEWAIEALKGHADKSVPAGGAPVKGFKPREIEPEVQR